ncbi:MAG TPA: phosphoserine transaminase, partial [Acidimicrobiia bacterium]|nr:phosphoserine transaminase [Acidimicrobiia bacterium]
LPAGYEVMLGNGGSTAFWDAAVFGLIDSRSTHLVLGEFSAKFAAAAKGAPHLADPEIIDTPPGATPLLAGSVAGDIYAYPHNETSTGVMVPLHRPDESDALVVVDGTSAAGGLRASGVAFDVYYFAPQKCFASDGGLWLALCSPAALARIEARAASDRWVPPSLDLGIALENSRLDQTYNTPSLATLFLFAYQLEWMLSRGGLEFAASRCDAMAAVVYSWADKHALATPFVTDHTYRSHVTATIDFDAAVDATQLAAELRANGILDVEPYRKLGRNQLRIALFPAIEPDDIETLTAAIDYLVERLAS